MKKKLPSWSKRTWIIIGVVVLVLVVLAGWIATRGGGRRVIPATDYQQAARTDIESRVSVTGTVEPQDVENVTTRLSGNIEKIMVKVGDRVRAGQSVAQVDTTQLQRQLNSLRSQAANQQGGGQQATEDSGDAGESIAVDESVDGGVVSGGSAGYADTDGGYYEDEGTYQDEQGTVSYSIVQSALPHGVRPVFAPAQFALAQYSTDSAAEGAGGGDLGSEIQNLQKDINSSTLRAESDGVVVAVPAREGAPAAGPVVSIGDPHSLVLRTKVNEADAGEVTPGDEVTFTTPSTGDREYQGTVLSASTVAASQGAGGESGAGGAPAPAAKPEFAVEIEVTGSTDGLKIGSTARARIRTEHAENKIAVPREAVYETAASEQAVLVVTPEGTVEERAVTPGLTTDFQVEITEGLEEGENVITKATTYHDAVGQQVELAAGGAMGSPAGTPASGAGA